VSLQIAGRSPGKAQAFAGTLGAAAMGVRVDRDADLIAQLAPLAPEVVVDASGPFQAYGAAPYRVLEAALAVSADYLDLADGAAFVEGVAAYDAGAKAAGRLALSGLSTVPALSFAAARSLAADLDVVEDLVTGIAPTPYAGMGLSVVRAVLGYAGKPVVLTRGGRVTTARATVETRRRVIAPPGVRPLPSRLFSLVDCPDLRLASQAWPGLRSVWTGGAPVPEALHRILIALAWLRLPLGGCGPLFHFVSRKVRWGEHGGGMFVEVAGRRGGERVRRSWELIAEGDDGPFIPAMAAAAVIRRRLAGRPPAPGARAATHELTLADFAPLFAQRQIVTGVRELDSASVRV
jgi:hypothetical protein